MYFSNHSFAKKNFISIVGLKGWMSTLWYESNHQSHLHIIQHFLLVIWVINFAIFCYWNLLWLNLLTIRVWLPYTQPHFQKMFLFLSVTNSLFLQKSSLLNPEYFCYWLWFVVEGSNGHKTIPVAQLNSIQPTNILCLITNIRSTAGN